MNVSIVVAKDLHDDLLQMFKELIEIESSIGKYFNLTDPGNLEPNIRDFFEKIFSRAENRVAIAYIDEKPAGFAIGGLMTKPPYHQHRVIGYIENLYVRKEFRKNHIAKKLLDHIEKFLHMKGAEDCTLFVLNENKLAKSMYKRHGYEVETVQIYKRLG